MTESMADPNGSLVLDLPFDDTLAEYIDGPTEPGSAVEAGNPEELNFGPVPIRFALPKRTVSGRYRGMNASFQLELRLDVDGKTALKKISGDYSTSSGATTSYFGSWIVHSPVITVTSSSIVAEGTATTTWSTTFTKLRVTVPRSTIFQPQRPATVAWSNAGGTPGAVYSCNWESASFRSLQWEQDSVVGAVPFLSYNTASLLQPASSPARVLTIAAAFKEAGLELLAAGVPNIVTTGDGTDGRWSEAELHAAMVTNFSLWADAPQWRVYTLVASRFTDDGVRGIMYDASGSFQRQGMAVFHDAVAGTDAASQRAQLRTYVHELGHCFNLLHSWQKNLANPPQPVGANGGLGDLSWMNYAWKFQPPAPAPGGDAAYWANFPFQFTASELAHLRHGMRNNVIMGGNAFGAGAADVDPGIFADRVVDNSGLALELRAAASFMLGEPVVVELKLASTDRRSRRTHGYLHPRDGLVHVAVQGPNGKLEVYRPLMPRCTDHDRTIVLDDDRPALYESAYIGFGSAGFTFEQPGTYQLRAVYVADDGSHVVSPTLRLRIRTPVTAADEQVAELLFADGQGELLYLLGSDSEALAGANAAMDELVERHAKHPLGVFGKLVKGVNAERDFKSVTTGKNCEVRPAQTAESISLLRSVVDASSGDRGIDNITLNMATRRLASAELKAGDVDKATATLDRMPEQFAKKGVKASVVKTIAVEAAAFKTELLAERDQ